MAKTKTPEELELEAREARRANARASLAHVEDPDGPAWHAKAGAKWDRAVDFSKVIGGAALDYYDPEPLPDFGSRRPAHVKRELLGRFLVNRDSLVVHDCYAATPACELDTIRNGTFYHFLSELLETVEEETPCGECMGA